MMRLSHRHLFAGISANRSARGCDRPWNKEAAGKPDKKGDVMGEGKGKCGKGDAKGLMVYRFRERSSADRCNRAETWLVARRADRDVKVPRPRGRNDYRSCESKKTYACIQA